MKENPFRVYFLAGIPVKQILIKLQQLHVCLNKLTITDINKLWVLLTVVIWTWQLLPVLLLAGCHSQLHSYTFLYLDVRAISKRNTYQMAANEPSSGFFMGGQRGQGYQMALNVLPFRAVPGTTPWVTTRGLSGLSGGSRGGGGLDLASGPRSRLGKKKEREEKKTRQDSL